MPIHTVHRRSAEVSFVPASAVSIDSAGRHGPRVAGACVQPSCLILVSTALSMQRQHGLAHKRVRTKGQRDEKTKGQFWGLRHSLRQDGDADGSLMVFVEVGVQIKRSAPVMVSHVEDIVFTDPRPTQSWGVSATTLCHLLLCLTSQERRTFPNRSGSVSGLGSRSSTTLIATSTGFPTRWARFTAST